MVPWETGKIQALLALISYILQGTCILCSLLSYVNFYGSRGCKCIHHKDVKENIEWQLLKLVHKAIYSREWPGYLRLKQFMHN